MNDEEQQKVALIQAIADAAVKEATRVYDEEAGARAKESHEAYLFELDHMHNHRDFMERYYNDVGGLWQRSAVADERLAAAFERIASVLEKKGTL